jgi:tetratricopeptide (TPR) repeat protein
LRKAADDAVSAAPEDTAAVRVKVDAMRIAGEVDQARTWVSKAGTSSQAETSYVLAALDMAEMAPPWNTVVDRLRIAAAAEGNLGRARAALVYALARAGDSSSAKAELDRLSQQSRPHPLLAALRAFVTRGSAKVGSETRTAPPGSATITVDANAQVRPSPGGAEALDPRVLVQQAADAENRGQLAKAAKLYEDALRVDGHNSEAQAGLGTVALKQGDPATARQHFVRALAINPNYVPALVGQADALWQEGDKNGAVAKYRDLIDRFPESAGYPAYVKTRAAGSSSGTIPGSAPQPDEPPGSRHEARAAPAASKPSELTLPSNVPSDLPGTPP